MNKSVAVAEPEVHARSLVKYVGGGERLPALDPAVPSSVNHKLGTLAQGLQRVVVVCFVFFFRIFSPLTDRFLFVCLRQSLPL